MIDKRFKYCMFDGFEDNGESLDNIEVQNLLNEFNNENERLRKENKELHRVIEENEKMIQSIYEELTQLRLIKNNLRNIKTQWNWVMNGVDYD